MRGSLIVALAAAAACSGSDETAPPGGDGGTGAPGGDGGTGAGAVGGASGGGGANGGGGAVGGGGGGGATTCSGSGYVEQHVAVPTCDGLAPGTEDCHYRMVYDEGLCCDAAPCDRLVVFWAGGNQTCDEPGAFDAILHGYADAGFVTACAQPYTTEDEGGNYPYYLEFDRMNRVMQGVRSDAAALWTGEKLLIAGTSHGGTAPAVVIANQQALNNHAAVWTGSTHTAVLLNDGISNPRTLEEWAGAAGGCGLFHARFTGRYNGGTGPLIHSCNNNQCYCSNSTNDWALDTVTIGAVDPTSPYGCADFERTGAAMPYRFVSCGGEGAAPCGLLGDIVPDEQQLQPYQALNACPGIVASYQDYPACSHVACGGFAANCGGVDSLAWLVSLGW